MTNQNTPQHRARKTTSFVVNPNLNLDKQLLVLLFSVLVIAFIAQLGAAMSLGGVRVTSNASTDTVVQVYASK